MRDFDWFDELYCVVKEDGTFAGVPCRSIEEAIELSGQHEGSKIFEMKLDNESLWEYEDYNCDDDTGYDPYMGCFTDEC
jgi:hypothetical protein